MARNPSLRMQTRHASPQEREPRPTRRRPHAAGHTPHPLIDAVDHAIAAHRTRESARLAASRAACPRGGASIREPADVAQLVEHFTRNEGVSGSNPLVGFEKEPATAGLSRALSSRDKAAGRGAGNGLGNGCPRRANEAHHIVRSGEPRCSSKARASVLARRSAASLQRACHASCGTSAASDHLSRQSNAGASTIASRQMRYRWLARDAAASSSDQDVDRLTLSPPTGRLRAPQGSARAALT